MGLGFRVVVYASCLGALKIRGRIIVGTQKQTILLAIYHVGRARILPTFCNSRINGQSIAVESLQHLWDYRPLLDGGSTQGRVVTQL